MQYSHEEDSSLIFSESTNLLQQSAYKYQLQDREEPNLYRHLFDYKSVPKVSISITALFLCVCQIKYGLQTQPSATGSNQHRRSP